MNTIIWRPGVLILVAIGAARADDPKPLTDQQFDQLRGKVQAKLDELRKGAEFPGVTVGFALADGRSAGVSSGFADAAKTIPLKPDDRMLAGSIGKTFVAAVVLQLFEEGKIGLDDKLEKWLGKEPWYARLPNGPDLTVRHLLTHTAGLPEYFEVKGVTEAVKADPDRVWKPEELVAFVLDAKPLFAPGKGFAYADTDYILVGMAAEKAGGKPLFAEIERRLLNPLKLERTTPSDKRVIPGLVPGHAAIRNPFGYQGPTVIDGKFVMNPQMEYAGGGLASTPEDLARWAKAVYEGKAFQKKETLAAMLTGLETGTGRGGGKGAKYGLGVQIRESEWGPSYGHGGWFPGYLSEVEYFPEKKVAIAVQFNTDAGRTLKKGLRAYIGDVAKIVLDEK
jgi:D-alanyl-D-alanine carboxypeptidase